MLKKYLRRIEIRLEIFVINIFMYMVLTEIYLLILYMRIKEFFKN